MPQPQIRGPQLNQATLPVDNCLKTLFGAPIIITAPLVGESLTYGGSPAIWSNGSAGDGVSAGDGLNSVGGSPVGTQILSVDATVTRLNATLNNYSFAGTVSLNLTDTTQAADEATWRISNAGGQLLIATRTDTGAAGNNAIAIDRTGITVDSITLPAPTISTASGVGTRSALQINAAVPTIVINDTDATASEGVWDITSTSASSALNFRTRTDAHGTGSTWLSVERSGTQVTKINLGAISVTVNDNEVLTSNDIPAIIQTVVEQVLAQLT